MMNLSKSVLAAIAGSFLLAATLGSCENGCLTTAQFTDLVQNAKRGPGKSLHKKLQGIVVVYFTAAVESLVTLDRYGTPPGGVDEMLQNWPASEIVSPLHTLCPDVDPKNLNISSGPWEETFAQINGLHHYCAHGLRTEKPEKDDAWRCIAFLQESGLDAAVASILFPKGKARMNKPKPEIKRVSRELTEQEEEDPTTPSKSQGKSVWGVRHWNRIVRKIILFISPEASNLRIKKDAILSDLAQQAAKVDDRLMKVIKKKPNKKSEGSSERQSPLCYDMLLEDGSPFMQRRAVYLDELKYLNAIIESCKDNTSQWSGYAPFHQLGQQIKPDAGKNEGLEEFRKAFSEQLKQLRKMIKVLEEAPCGDSHSTSRTQAALLQVLSDAVAEVKEDYLKTDHLTDLLVVFERLAKLSSETRSRSRRSHSRSRKQKTNTSAEQVQVESDIHREKLDQVQETTPPAKQKAEQVEVESDINREKMLEDHQVQETTTPAGKGSHSRSRSGERVQQMKAARLETTV